MIFLYFVSLITTPLHNTLALQAHQFSINLNKSVKMHHNIHMQYLLHKCIDNLCFFMALNFREIQWELNAAIEG